MPTDQPAPSTPQSVEVDLFSKRIPLPEPLAREIIAARDADKAERRQLAEQFGALQAQIKAAEAEKARAAEAAEVAKLTSKGEYETALKMHGEKFAQRERALSERLRNKALAEVVASASGILPKAAADIAAQLAGRCTYDADSDTLAFIDAAGRPLIGSDGKPQTADAVLADFLAERPWYRQPVGSPGSGADGVGAKTHGKQTITRQEYDRNPMAFAKLLASGKAVVID